MAIEIEKKFLVKNLDWKAHAHAASRLKQGYLSEGTTRSVRVRTKGDKQAFINIKSSTTGISRLEFEYEIPVDEAEIILRDIAITPVIDKTRYLVTVDRHLWEVDEFHGENEGLIVAEVELSDVNEAFTVPEWAGDEVSDNPDYYNMNIMNQNWRKSYPENLLKLFTAEDSKTGKHNPDEFTDLECRDGC